MEKLEDVLSAGGKTNSLGRAAEVLDAVLADMSLLDELYECMFADDAWVRMRAADCFEKICRVHPEWIEPYVDKMLEELGASSQPSIQWHLAQVFAQVHLTDKQKSRAIAWMKNRISTIEVDWIVSVNTMKTLVQFCRAGLVPRHELVPLVELQTQHKSNAVRKKAARFLEDL